jgi:enolase
MFKIKSLKATEILDSRGNPTLSVACFLESGFFGEASVPSGKSTGVHEMLEIRDGDKTKYNGMGVDQAVFNVNLEINNFIQNKDFDQKTLDEALVILDGTKNKGRLGANAILGVSLSFARACAKEGNIELYEYLGKLGNNTNFTLPIPMLNIINGGKHANNSLELQEFMIVPTDFDSFAEKIEVAKNIIDKLKLTLEDKNYEINFGDEGGFAPKLESNEEALDILMEAIFRAKYNIEQVKIGIDSAASSFYKNNTYNFKNQTKDNQEMISWYQELIKKYPIISIEDGLAEDDWGGFTELTKTLGDKIKIIGDDLTVTNINRINTAIEKKAINAVLIKLNQIGTLSETIEAINLTKSQNWTPVISHRSGETTDTFIADLAVGLSCPFIKSGAPTRIERMCKYDRLIEIERIIKKLN